MTSSSTDEIVEGVNNIEIEEDENTLKLLAEALEKFDVNIVADRLNLANGTVRRWIELENVPKSYEFDLLKMLDKQIDYSKYSSKEKDQFYTPIATAKMCYEKFCDILLQYEDDERKYRYIEPSAGDGSFLKVLPTDRTIGLDIEPKHESVIQQDYLTWTPEQKTNNIVFGNPPFGLRGHLALRFINHSFDFADYVCFILPQLFESDGKGVPRKRVKGYNLIHSEKLDSMFIEPSKKEIAVNTIFQVWSKHHKNDVYTIKDIDTSTIKIYSVSDGGTPSSTRNKDMHDKCDVFLPSTCFGKENMRYYESFEDLPGRKGYGIVFNKNKAVLLKKFKDTDWSEVAFLSTNSAYNIRTSQISAVFT